MLQKRWRNEVKEKSKKKSYKERKKKLTWGDRKNGKRDGSEKWLNKHTQKNKKTK